MITPINGTETRGPLASVCIYHQPSDRDSATNRTVVCQDALEIVSWRFIISFVLCLLSSVIQMVSKTPLPASPIKKREYLHTNTDGPHLWLESRSAWLMLAWRPILQYYLYYSEQDRLHVVEVYGHVRKRRYAHIAK